MTTTTSQSNTIRPSLARQLRGALSLESRLLRLYLVLLTVEVIWWGFAWLYLRGLSPTSYAVLSNVGPGVYMGTVARIQEISDALIMVTPPLLAILSLAPSIAQQLNDKSASFSLTQTLTKFRWLTLRLVPALAMGAVLSLVSGLAYTFLVAPHLPGSLPPDWAYFMVTAPVVVGVTILLTLIAALLAILIRKSLTTSVVTLIIYLVIVSVGTGLYPHLLPASTATTPYLSPHLDAKPTQVISPGPAPLNSNVFGETYLLRGESIPFQRVMNATSKCLRPNNSGLMRENSPNNPACEFLRSVTYRLEYQPASNYYPLAWVMFGLLVSLSALVCIGIALYLRRLQL
ncbi:hypothetical protein [Ferrimicrobium acidiphilum]|uniref:ABC-2 family transporter protein n=2 Tax=Ferrimicrobium TaxID=121038 RepID=A0ABV3Y632_9ACTN